MCQNRSPTPGGLRRLSPRLLCAAGAGPAVSLASGVPVGCVRARETPCTDTQGLRAGRLDPCACPGPSTSHRPCPVPSAAAASRRRVTVSVQTQCPGRPRPAATRISRGPASPGGAGPALTSRSLQVRGRAQPRGPEAERPEVSAGPAALLRGALRPGHRRPVRVRVWRRRPAVLVTRTRGTVRPQARQLLRKHRTSV